MKLNVIVFACFLLLLSGCTAAVVGGGAAGGYKVATDERSAGTMLDDATISAKVKAEMIGDEAVKARNIDVDTIDGVVMLSGFVDSQAEANRAAAIAKTVPGVVRVKNDLRVGSRTIGQGFDDKVLGSKIKAKLVEEPGIKSLNIDVDVYLGTVNLTGFVKNQDQKNTVLSIARSVKGTKGIVDNIKIK